MKDLRDLKDETIKYLTGAHKRVRGDRLGPSEISSSCPRQLVLGRDPEAALATPDEKLSDITAAMEGTALHRYFQEEVFPRLPGIEIVECEKRIKTDSIHGFVDVVAKDKETGETFIIEIKTVKQAKFDAMRKSGTPLEEHVRQLLIYMDHEGLKRGLLFVVNRGLFSDKAERRAAADPAAGLDEEMFLTFTVDLGTKAAAAMLEETKAQAAELGGLIKDFVENGETPEIPDGAQPNKFPCLWCKFKNKCWPEAYRTVGMKGLPEYVQDEVNEVFKKYLSAKKRYIEAAEEMGRANKEVSRFFRRNSFLNAWAVSGENYTIGTDGTPYLIRNVSPEAAPETGRAADAKKNKPPRRSPRPGKIIGVGQTSLFDEAGASPAAAAPAEHGASEGLAEYLEDVMAAAESACWSGR